jgi:hypothetical protein
LYSRALSKTLLEDREVIVAALQTLLVFVLNYIRIFYFGVLNQFDSILFLDHVVESMSFQDISTIVNNRLRKSGHFVIEQVQKVKVVPNNDLSFLSLFSRDSLHAFLENVK